MRPFKYINANSYKEASELLDENKQNKVAVMAGGTDLLNTLKHAILEENPEYVVNLKTIPDAAGIVDDGDGITIKAMTKLTAVVDSSVVQKKAKAFAEAAHSVATPLIRNLGTVGGNICQDVRCWYYRYAHEAGGRMDCSRKGGDICYAIQGDNRYHSIFGGMKTHASACKKGCPAGTDISEYLEQIRKGDWDAAARIIMCVNPIPMCTSRICPHPCQDNCNQSGYGECVNIHCVERTLGDYILKNADKFYTKPENATGKKIGIIGAGPGGLTCAYYLRLQGHDVTIIDAHEKAGGVLQYGIPHYRLPRNILDGVISAIRGMGVKFELNTVVGKDIQMDDVLHRFDSVYFGTGAWKQPILGIQGEEMTQFGLDFLVEVNTYLEKAINNDVLVCGGGNVAMDVAMTAKRLGAKNVCLVCLEQESEMPASAEEVARAKEEGIEIYNGWGLGRIFTDDNEKVSGLESMRCTSVYDENHRFAPVYDENDIRIFNAETIILATGQRVDVSFLGEKFESQIKSVRGLLEVDEDTYQTKNEKIFAGGDVVTGPNVAIRAINAGGLAARAMSSKMGFSVRIDEKEEDEFLKFDEQGIKKTIGARLKERSVDERTLTDEDSESLKLEQAAGEAKRCMNCGCYSVNASDLSPVLVAYGGKVVTNKKEIAAKDFFTTKLKAYDMLDKDEIVVAVKIPDMSDYTTGYEKMRIRTAIDFALLGLAYAYKYEDGKIKDISLVFGGAAPVPVKLTEVEKYLIGKKPSKEVAKKAGEIAVKDTVAMSHNSYKINSTQTMMTRLVESMIK